MLDSIMVGIFWVTSEDSNANIIYDIETYEATGKYFINYKASHFEMWDKLAARQFGGKYKHYDCYFFPRGRVLYNCETGKTLVYADKKILTRLSSLEPMLAYLFALNNYEFCSDEHYQSAAKWQNKSGEKQ